MLTTLRNEWLAQHVARVATVEALKKTSIEFTTFRIGYFTDYFGIPHIESRMAPVAIQIDVANKVAAIPGSGDDLVTFTYSFDVARFVEAALDLSHWEEDTFCVGDTCSLNDVVKMAEEARGS